MDSAHNTKKEPSAEANEELLSSLIGYNIKRAFNIIQADLAHTLEPFDLRMMTFTALTLIVENPGLSQSQLAESMEIERPNLVVIIDELERRDLIIRDRVPEDRRAYALKVTLSGRRLAAKAMKAVIAHEAKLFAGIDAKTLETITKAMGQIRKAAQGGAK